MTSYATGFLYAADALGQPQEIINHARTLAYMRDFANACGQGGLVLTIDEDVCPGLAWQPCVSDDWTLDDFGDFTESPWWSSDPGALDVIGMWINEWTGLDAAHRTRSVYGTGVARGGASFGPAWNRHRVWAMDITLFGTSERGLNYLFRWLESMLSSTCDPCGNWDLWIREFCPTSPATDPEDGIARVEGAVLLEGPTWSAPPMERAGCFMRNVELTIAVGDPCMYRPSTAVVAASDSIRDAFTPVLASLPELAPMTYVDCDFYTGTTGRVSSQITVPPYGAAGPKVKISSVYFEYSGVRAVTPPILVAGFADPNGFGLDSCSRPRLGQTVTARLPTGSELILDYAKRRSYYRDLYADDSRWVDGSIWLLRQDEFSDVFGTTSTYPRWFSFANCGTGYIVVEPYFNVIVVDPASLVHENYFTVTIDNTDFFGC